MRKLHLEISTADASKIVEDYSKRLACKPCVVVPGEYALWRTDTINFSVRLDSTIASGSLRHLGWEDLGAEAFSFDTDVNGIVWETFSAEQQADEIEEAWPGTGYVVS